MGHTRQEATMHDELFLVPAFIYGGWHTDLIIPTHDPIRNMEKVLMPYLKKAMTGIDTGYLASAFFA